MFLLNPKKWGVAVGAGLLATVALLPHAEAELVYEDGGVSQSAPTSVGAPSATSEDRSDMREALGASQKVQVTLQSNPQTSANPTALTSATNGSTATATAETQNYSKTELMRRERQREEIKNEDILQERLEELRLRDERRRTDELLAANGSAAAASSVGTPAPAVSANAVAVAPLKEEVVGTLAPTVATAPAGSSVAVASVSPAPTYVAGESSVHAASYGEHAEHERTMFTISPRAGISNMSGSNFFDIRPRFSGGIAGAVSASDNFSFEAGWMYSEYGVALTPTNFAVYQASMYAPGNNEAVAMKQNVFDAGMKLHFLGQESRVRPFVGAGGAYSRSFINYDSRYLSMMNQSGNPYASDYQVSQFLGFLSAGLDVKITKNISVGALFKYYAVFSSRESSSLNPMSMYGAYYNPGFAAYQPDADKRFVGASLAQSSFYSILGGVSFTF